jgi:hypothetical protein
VLKPSRGRLCIQSMCFQTNLTSSASCRCKLNDWGHLEQQEIKTLFKTLNPDTIIYLQAFFEFIDGHPRFFPANSQLLGSFISYSMAGSRLQKNKPHKTRFASKSSRHAHKLSTIDSKGISKGAQHHVSKGARAARLQRNKMVRDQKRATLLAERRASTGSASPPRILVRKLLIYLLWIEFILFIFQCSYWSTCPTNA